jgi:hypothetical protein
MPRAGLRRVVKTVRSKNGTARRSYWVKGAKKAKRVAKFIGKHSGKIATGVAVAGAAYGLYKAHKFNQNKGAAFHGFKDWVNQGAQRQAYRAAAGRKDDLTPITRRRYSPEYRAQRDASFWADIKTRDERVASAERSGHYSATGHGHQEARHRLPSRAYRKREG